MRLHISVIVFAAFCHYSGAFRPSAKRVALSSRVAPLQMVAGDKKLTVKVESAPGAGAEKFKGVVSDQLKIPVWPVWGGVFAQLAEWAGLRQLVGKLLDTVGGRVVPMTLGNMDVSPFLLLAHHAHSFTPFDPTRTITNLVQPEGFPAHPHAGFSTLTITLEGGLAHRDSEGLSMDYSDGDAQFMKSGRGVIHEEMWDLKRATKNKQHKKIEIYQLWINSPTKTKFDLPQCALLKAEDMSRGSVGDDCALDVVCGEVHVSGEVLVGPGSEMSETPVCVMQVRIPSSSSKPMHLTTSADASLAVYVRRGSMLVDGVEAHPGSLTVFKHDSTSPLAPLREATALLQAGAYGLDALVLVGERIREPVVMSGPFVQASERDYNIAAAAFQKIGYAGFWDYKVSEKEWRDHISSLDLQGKIKEVLDQYRPTLEARE